ncbi:MAG TPA: DUF308 domain-containing protein [Vicinamibacterales bacterium]|nr:DUF308 domain-containing protein [Vicinamibacterales bacterium]
MRATGIVFLILGILAIIEPAVAGLAIALFVGWLLVFGGVAHAAGAFGGRAGRVVWHALIALIYFAGGLYLLTHPVLGLTTLTLYLAVVLVAEAILEVIAYFATRGESGSEWRIVNALVTVLLGMMIWRQWPSSSAWAIGTIVGVNLIMTGVSRLMLGAATRRFTG